jgi:FtsZ-binding cell division protein ZapB
MLLYHGTKSAPHFLCQLFRRGILNLEKCGYLPENLQKTVKLQVMSSLAGTLAEARAQISIFSKYKNFAIGAGFVGLIALVGVAVTTVGVISDANKYVSDAVMLVKKNDKGDLDIRNFAVRGEVNSLESEITQLAVEIELIKEGKKRDFDESDLAMRSDVDTLKTEIIQLKEEINRLKEDIRVSHEGTK